MTAGQFWQRQLNAALYGCRHDAKMLDEILASSVLEYETTGLEQQSRLHTFPDGSQLSSWFDGLYLVLHLGDASKDELV